MSVHIRHARLRTAGFALLVAGVITILLALLVPDAEAATAYSFEGNCVGAASAGTCVLDEPEGKNPAVHGLVTYVHAAQSMTFHIDTPSPITEVQICMQRDEEFATGANVCAGSHGPHATFSAVGHTYTVDLAANGLADANPLFWTLHVVAGGRTLQVVGRCSPPLPPTTTTTVAPTTTTTVAPTTTTTVVPTTSTSVAPSTTAGTTSTTTALVTTTTSPAPGGTTVTTSSLEVRGRQFARTGGPRWWALQLGAALMLAGVALLVGARVLHPARP
jgi:hypothetical protein